MPVNRIAQIASFLLDGASTRCWQGELQVSA